MLLTGLSGIVGIAGGYTHSLALDEDGEVWTWGKGSYGQLGNGFSNADPGATQSTPAPLNPGTVAPPSVSPAPGTYAQAQTVTLTGAAGTTIRYTLDGSEPGASSTIYTAPLTIGVTTTLKVKAFQSDWTPSATTTAVYTIEEVATPVITPAAGTYTSAQTVTITTATPGATIHYTLDGSEPSTSSPQYASAFQVSTSKIVKAKAWKTGFTASAVSTASYVISSEDTTPPTVQTRARPQPTATGWHNGDVTVSFTCTDVSGVSLCPEPVTVTQEGAGIVVSRTASDSLGNQTPVTVTLNIDKTAPAVVLDEPSNFVTTTATSITLNAEITETLSGLASALCNGVATPVVNGEMTCVAELRPGTNSVVVSVVDGAGNSGSHGLTVVREVTTITSLAVSPAKLGILLGGERDFELIGDAGTPIVADSWSSSDENVATIAVVDGQPLLTAVGGGTATITAEYQTLSATATVTVVSGFVLPFGTMQWGFAPLPGGTNDDMVAASAVDSSFFSYFVHDETSNVIRAVDDSGRETARFPVGEGAQMLFAHVKGGLVIFDGGELVRIAAPIDGRPWRYAGSGDARQAPDGTIYVGAVGGVDVIDGDSGNVIARERFPLPVLGGGCPQLPAEEWLWGSGSSNSIIDSNGRFHVAIYHDVPSQPACSDLRLLTMTGGSASYRQLGTWATDIHIMPADTEGGIGAAWIEFDGYTTRAYVSDSGVSLSHGNVSSPMYDMAGLVDLQNHRGYTFTNEGWGAVDTVTGATIWTVPVIGPALAVYGDGSIAVLNGTTLLHVDMAGVPTAVGTMNLTNPIPGSGGSWVGFQAGEMVSVVGAGGMAAGQWYMNNLLENAGNPQKQGAPIPGCAFTFFTTFRKGLEGDKEYTYRFHSGQWNLALSFKDEIRQAFRSWSRANQSTGHGASFKEWVSSSGDPLNFTLLWLVLPVGQGGGLVGGGLSTSENGQGYSTGGTIQFNADPAVVSFLPMTYRKIGLHELGHLHGLSDGSGINGSSVMNQLAGKDDATGNIALDVTFCDAQKANDALVRPWP